MWTDARMSVMQRICCTSLCVLPVWVFLAGYGESRAVAQVSGTADWWWEASADGGQTWSRDRLVVDAGPRDVLIRSFCSFQSVGQPGTFPYTYFAEALGDPIVTGVGSTDSIRSVNGGRTTSGGGPNSLVMAQRFGTTLKIDYPEDARPPGEGTRWMIFSQNPLQNRPDNPMALVNYTLTLDGSVGTREASIVLLSRNTDAPNQFVTIGLFPPTGGTIDEFPELRQFPVQIEVVPGPGAFSLIIAVSSVWIGRRRRGVH
jgi:hypothetical protein